MYRWLVGNLSLWSVKPNVSRVAISEDRHDEQGNFSIWVCLSIFWVAEHCYTHCIPRLNAVIDGTDNGGITKDVNWQGGGGYKFYELAPSLIEKDKYGNPVISSKYNSNMLMVHKI